MNRIIKLISVSALFFIIIISIMSCGESSEQKTQTTVSSETTDSKKSMPLTAEYLIGEWCHSYNEAGGQIIQENYNWVFKKNGEFYAQNSIHSEKLSHQANWKIEGNKLSIKPKFLGGPHEVIILSKDEFILKFHMDLRVKRGRCR